MADNPISLSELGKALDSLIFEDIPPLIEDDDITVSRLAEHAKCSPTKAGRMLEEWTKAGRLEFIGYRRVPHGNRVRAWRLKGTNEENRHV